MFLFNLIFMWFNIVLDISKRRLNSVDNPLIERRGQFRAKHFFPNKHNRF